MITTFPQARLWEFVARSSPNGLLVVGPDGRILVANRAVELQFGYDGAELVGRPIEMLVPEVQRGAHAADRALLRTNPDGRRHGSRPLSVGRPQGRLD